LERYLAAGTVMLLDARGGPDAAARFAQAAIPGARRVDLERELSAPFTDAAVGGRHPLPDYQEFVQRVESWGIGPRTPVVVCDDKGGGNAAARGWWMLRAIGVQQVAVLDGGCQLYPQLTSGNPEAPLAPPPVAPEPFAHSTHHWQWPLATIDDVELASQLTQSHQVAGRDPGPLVLDVREAYRYLGESEPIDSVAGHIPGAANCPFLENLDSDGRFLAPFQLREKYNPLLQGRSPADLIVHCGSGVTACHTLLALEVAGLHGARLYVGSWSQWSRNQKPIATGS